MNQTQKIIFLNLIQQGNGLGRSCVKVGLSIKETRKIIEKDKELKQKIQGLIEIGLSKIVLTINEVIEGRKGGSLEELENKLDSFVTTIPKFRHRKYFDPFNCIDEYMSGMTLEDISMKYDMEYLDLVQIINDNKFLRSKIDIQERSRKLRVHK